MLVKRKSIPKTVFTMRRTQPEVDMAEWLRAERGERSVSRMYTNLVLEEIRRRNYIPLGEFSEEMQRPVEKPVVSAEEIAETIPAEETEEESQEEPKPLLSRTRSTVGGMTWEDVDRLKEIAQAKSGDAE